MTKFALPGIERVATLFLSPASRCAARENKRGG